MSDTHIFFPMALILIFSIPSEILPTQSHITSTHSQYTCPIPPSWTILSSSVLFSHRIQYILIILLLHGAALYLFACLYDICQTSNIPPLCAPLGLGAGICLFHFYILAQYSLVGLFHPFTSTPPHWPHPQLTLIGVGWLESTSA